MYLTDRPLSVIWRVRHLFGVCVMFLILGSSAGAIESQGGGQEKTAVPPASGKLTLAQCIEIAINRNSQVLIAQRQVESAQATAYSSWSGVMPTVNASILNVNHNRSGDRIVQQNAPIGRAPDGSLIYGRVPTTQPGSSLTNYSSGLSVSQPLYDGGRSWRNIQQARQNVQNSSLNVDSAERQVALTVKQQYYNLLKAIRLQEVFEEQVKLSEEQLKRSDSMYEIGSVAKVDVLQARANLGEVRVSLLRQQQAVLQAKAALNTALGLNVNAPIDIVDDVVSDTTEPPVAMTLDQAMPDALRENPDIRRLTGSVESAKLSVKIARGALLPSVNGSLGYQRFSSELNRVYGSFGKNWTVSFGLNMSLNVLNGTQTYANIDRTQADLLVAEENLELLKRSTAFDIKQALLNLETARQVVTLSKETILASEEGLRLAQERYRVGSGTLLDIFNAQVILARAKSNLVTAQYDYKIAQASLDKAMGRPVK